MKYFKEGEYYVNLVHPSFRSVIDNEDFTDMVSDFSKFSYLGVNVMGDTIRLINTPDKGFIFVRYPSADGKFIRANEILKSLNTNEVVISKTVLTPKETNDEEWIQEMKDINPLSMSPLEALNFLYEIKKKIK